MPINEPYASDRIILGRLVHNPAGFPARCSVLLSSGMFLADRKNISLGMIRLECLRAVTSVTLRHKSSAPSMELRSGPADETIDQYLEFRSTGPR